ncbi:MAG: hypothetical protein Q9163_000274 [Psora crenata]
MSTSAAPTNIPGRDGLSACHGRLFSLDSPCPYAKEGYCECSGTFVPSLGNSSIIECDYPIQPTADNCPVVTAFSISLAAASQASASQALVESARSASSASVAAAGPKETGYNHKGSGICGSINREACEIAFSQYDDASTYKKYTSYVASAGEMFVNHFFRPFANQGYTAIFTCDKMTIGMGWQVSKSKPRDSVKMQPSALAGTTTASEGATGSEK